MDKKIFAAKRKSYIEMGEIFFWTAIDASSLLLSLLHSPYHYLKNGNSLFGKPCR
jgi:hypothetical protein